MFISLYCATMKNILLIILLISSFSAFARYECTNSDAEELNVELTEYGYYIDYFNSMGDREVSFLSTKVLVDNFEVFELELPTEGHLQIYKAVKPMKATIKFFNNSLPISFDCEDLTRQM